MVEQLEDCIDVIKILYQDEFDSKWMFDQSSGHCKKQEDGLNVNGMNKEYGGKQKKLRDTFILEEDGYLGNCLPRVLNKHDTQHFTFKEGDSGLLHLSQSERDAKKFDMEIPGQSKPKKKKERRVNT